jgi:phage I-like protein
MAKILIAPTGSWPHPAGVVQLIDAEAVAAMVAAEDKARPVLVDLDHYSDLTPDQRKAIDDVGVLFPSEAAAWVRDLEARPDGLWGEMDRTDLGDDVLSSGRYRYLSPVFKTSDCQAVERGVLRPRRLYKIALTNLPNIGSSLALANRDSGSADQAFAGPIVELAPIVSKAMRVETDGRKIAGVKMDELKQILGLDPTADDAAILAAVQAIQAKVSELETAASEALASKNAEAEALANRARETLADADLAQFADVVPETDRANVRSMLLSNRDATVAHLSTLISGKPPIAPAAPALFGIDRVRKAFTK